MTTTTNTTDANKALVLAGIKGVFIDRDPTVLDRLFSDDYRQHNPQIPNGTAAIKALLGKLPADFKYEPGPPGGVVLRDFCALASGSDWPRAMIWTSRPRRANFSGVKVGGGHVPVWRIESRDHFIRSDLTQLCIYKSSR
jgi:hypothetical protein